MRQLLYLYGISAASANKLLPHGLTGVDRASVQAHAVDDLVAWTSQVSPKAFGEDLAHNMESLDWLADQSVRHQDALSKIADKVAVIPARFGTVFRTDQSLEEHIREHRDTSLATLQRIDGAEEWGVKVIRRKRSPATVAADSGTDYLRQKAALRQTRTRELAPEVIAFASELENAAVASASIGKLSSGQANLEWQAAFLVKKNHKSSWEKVLKRYAAEWADEREIECTGPWPPYSFV